MADVQTFGDPKTNIRSMMLNALTGATGTSSWTEIESRDKGSIDIRISSAATVQVRGSNEFMPNNNCFVPDESDDGILLATVTASDLFTWSKPLKWIKLLVTGNNGAVSAWLEGV